MSNSHEELVPVESYSIRPQADRAQQVLKAAGIESVIRGDDAGGWVPPLGFATGGIALLVRADQLEEARKILDGSEEGEPGG